MNAGRGPRSKAQRGGIRRGSAAGSRERKATKKKSKGEIMQCDRTLHFERRQDFVVHIS